MSRYNVVRSNGEQEGTPLPAVLEAVLDGEVAVGDPRVVEVLKADADAARRFKETQRVTDRLSRRLTTPDLSGSILAVVHAKQPYAIVRRRGRVSPQRLAFAGGLAAGIAMVVVLQTVAHRSRTEVTGTNVAVLDQPGTADVVHSNPDPLPERSNAVTTVGPARTPLAFHDPSKYEASTRSSGSAEVKVAGLGGDVDVTGDRSAAIAVALAGSALQDPCDSPTVGWASGSVPEPQFVGAGLLDLRVASASIEREPGKEWPPADINAFIDHISMCGVSDDLLRTGRSR